MTKPAYAAHGAIRGVLVTTRLPPELVEQIDALAKAEGITRSFALRRAAETGLKKLQMQRGAKIRALKPKAAGLKHPQRLKAKG